MAAEPYTFIITTAADWDGQTAFEPTRNDFTVSQDSRVYTITVPGPYGTIDASFRGVLKGERPKLVGIASNNANPLSVARVVADTDTPDAFRDEIDITPEMQYVMMYAGDSLAIVTNGGRRNVLTFVVNELSEANHFEYALRKPRAPQWRRFRIIRDSATGFELGLANGLWRPNFVFTQSHQVLVATSNDSGKIPLSSFCTFPRYAGCLVRVRFANISTKGHMHIVDSVTGNHRTVGGVSNMKWSKVAFVSHDDGIALRSGPPIAVGTQMSVDLMVARADQTAVLQGRYDRGL